MSADTPTKLVADRIRAVLVRAAGAHHAAAAAARAAYSTPAPPDARDRAMPAAGSPGGAA